MVVMGGLLLSDELDGFPPRTCGEPLAAPPPGRPPRLHRGPPPASFGGGGLGLAQTTAFCVPAASIGYWTHRLIEKGVKHEALTKRFGEPVLSFFDPDGMSLALVGISGTEAETAWSTGEIPAQH